MPPSPHLKPKLLVTGPGGRIGARLLALAAHRFEVVSLGRGEGFDLLNRRSVESAIDAHPDAAALVHLAAWTDVSKAYEQSGNKGGECWRINVDGTTHVARACAALGIHLVHVSTDFVFDGTKRGAYDETDLPSPIEWYGRTKLAAEEVARRSPSATILRISFPYVAGPSPKPDLVRGIVAKLAAGGEAKLFDDQTIVPTFADDVVQGALLCARLHPKETFHLVGSTPTTPFDLGRRIARAFNFDERLVVASSMAEYLKTDPRPRQARLHLSNAKWTTFATLHGLHPPLDLDAGLARVRREPA